MATYLKKWFNPLYFIINDIAKDSNVSTILIYGGKSSAKTVSICQFIAKQAYEKGYNSLAFRKQSAIVPTTLKKSFNLAIKKMYLTNACEIQDRRYLFQTAKQGVSEIVLKGLDDSEKAKGIESYMYVYLDELNHFEYEEYESFDMSLRGMSGQKIFASWNPVDQDSWVKKKLIDKYEFIDTEYTLPCEHSFVKKSICGKIVLIKTTYEDNYWTFGSPCGTYGFVDENLIAKYSRLKEYDYNSYAVNVLGEWGEINQGDSPFATQFDDKKHVSEAPVYDIKKQLIISIDFNLVPFCVTFHHFWNDSSGVHLHQFDEAEIKNGSIPAMIDFIKARYKVSLSNSIITGDAMGNRGDISQRDNASLYMQLVRGLGIRENQIKVSNNPTHENSRADVNYILFNFPDYKIHKNCVNTIRDLKNVQVDAFGSILKKDRKDINQRADYIDTVRYIIHNICYKWIELDQKK